MCYFFFVFFLLWAGRLLLVYSLCIGNHDISLFLHKLNECFYIFPSSSYSIFWITHVLLVDPFKEFILFTFFLVVSSSTLLTTSYSPFIFFILFSSSLKPTTTTTESFSKISLYLKSWVTWRYTIKWCCKKCVSKQKKGDHNCKRGDYDDGAIESRNDDDDVMCVCMLWWRLQWMYIRTNSLHISEQISI